MGEKITVKRIEMIYQDGRTLMQIDLWFEEQDKGGRVFLDTNDFFKMLSANGKSMNEN